MDMITGARLATELLGKAIALLVCCVLLTMASRQQQQQQRRKESRDQSQAGSPARGSRASSPQSGDHSSSSNAGSPPMSGASSPHRPHADDAAHLHAPRPVTYYETLLVSRAASPAEIKSAHRRLAIRYHPDKNAVDRKAGLTPAQCQAMFIQVQEAYEVLSDPEERRRYDYAISHRMRYKKLSRAAAHMDDEHTRREEADMTHNRYSFSSASASSSPPSARGSRRHSRDATATGTSARSSFVSAASFLALTVALFRVFILRPLASASLRYRVTRALKSAKNRVLTALHIRQALRALHDVRQWTPIQWLCHSCTVVTCLWIYLPMQVICFTRRIWRRLRATADATKPVSEPPTPRRARSRHASARDSFSAAHTQPMRVHVTPADESPVEAPLFRGQSQSSPADMASTESDSSSPSLSASPSASSMSDCADADADAHTAVATAAAHPTTSSPLSSMPLPSLAGRSLSENEFDDLDEWPATDADRDLTAAAKTHLLDARLKKSHSMPFTPAMNEDW